MMDRFDKILIVGFGNMAGAMVDGWMAAGYASERFTIYHPRRDVAPYGIDVVRQWPNAAFDAVLLAVKPHMIDDVAPHMQKITGPGTVIVSIMAGVELASLQDRFPDAGGFARLMPNLAVALNKSPNALVGRRLSDGQRAAVTNLAEDLGVAEWLPDETTFELVTALAGSGPGFVYRFIDALATGAANLGLEQEQAQRLAIRMVEGAAALAAQSDHSPRELARRVASPGGMTQRGLDVLDDSNNLADLMQDSLRAARDRGLEMADEAKGIRGKNKAADG